MGHNSALRRKERSMEIFKEAKWKSVMYAILYVLMGVILILFPETTASTLCYAVGGTAIVIGVIVAGMYLFRDASQNTYRNDFVSGLIFISIGILIFYKVELFIALVPFILGIAVIVSGFIKLQDCIDVRRMGYGNGLFLLLLAIVNVILGIILIINPFATVIILFIVMGVGLIFSGVSDLVTTLYLFQKTNKYKEDESKVNNSAEVMEDEGSKD